MSSSLITHRCAQLAFSSLAILSLLPILACNVSGVRGSGVKKTESRPVTGFSSVSLHGTGHVIIKQTGKESLSITTDDNLLPLLESKVNGTTLEIGPMNNQNLSPSKGIEFTIEVKELNDVTAAGAADIEAYDLAGKQLNLTMSGAGSAKAKGKVETLKVELAGAGSFDGEGLETKNATIRSAGVGNSVVRVSDNLDASVAGVGSIEYIGSPQVKQSVSGLGSIKKR